LLRDFLLAGDRSRRTLAGARVGLGALAAHRQALAVTQAAVAAEVHQALDIHGDVATQVALDDVVAVDALADARHLVVGQLVDPALARDAHVLADPGRHRPADAVDVGQGNLDPFLRRNVDPSNTCHFANSLNAADPGRPRPENHMWTSRIV